ncbi:SDR family NAD(P)-dependent oxidoreductase, partial [Klebsiella pneumoniae]
FITGAASGLGKAFALELAADGFTIGLADINATNLETVSKEVKIAGGNPLIYQLDVSDKEAYKIVAEKFLADAGGIDLLFNNAGVGDGGAF